MTTPTREELLELAKEAGFATFSDGMISVDNGYGTYIGCNGHLERFAALLQAQGEPQSSDQVWNEAIEAADVECQKILEKVRGFGMPDGVTACIGVKNSLQTLKRPSQAQDGISFAAQCQFDDGVQIVRGIMPASGAVDEQEAFETFAKENFFDLEKTDADGGYKSWPTRMAWNVWQETRRAALALSRAQATQPAQQAPAVRTTEACCIESYGSVGNTPIGALLNYQHNEIYALRALLSLPAAAPVNEQAVPEGMQRQLKKYDAALAQAGKEGA